MHMFICYSFFLLTPPTKEMPIFGRQRLGGVCAHIATWTKHVTLPLSKSLTRSAVRNKTRQSILMYDILDRCIFRFFLLCGWSRCYVSVWAITSGHTNSESSPHDAWTLKSSAASLTSAVLFCRSRGVTEGKQGNVDMTQSAKPIVMETQVTCFKRHFLLSAPLIWLSVFDGQDHKKFPFISSHCHDLVHTWENYGSGAKCGPLSFLIMASEEEFLKFLK